MKARDLRERTTEDLIDLERSLVKLDRLVDPAQPVHNCGEVAAGPGGVGIQFQRPPVILAGLV